VLDGQPSIRRGKKNQKKVRKGGKRWRGFPWVGDGEGEWGGGVQRPELVPRGGSLRGREEVNLVTLEEEERKGPAGSWP